MPARKVLPTKDEIIDVGNDLEVAGEFVYKLFNKNNWTPEELEHLRKVKQRLSHIHTLLKIFFNVRG